MRQFGGYFYRFISVRIYAFELVNIPSIPNDLPIVRKEQFMSDEALQAAMQEAGHWNEAELKRRQTLGDVGYLVMDNSRCVHYSWVTQRYRNNTEIGFEATPDESNPWIYDSYTSASHRGRFIYPHVLNKIAEDSQKNNSRRVWIDILDSNRSSVHGIATTKFVEVVVWEKKILFSFLVFHRRKIQIHSRLGLDFDRLSPRWT